MPRVLVVVPFPVDARNLEQRKAQMKAVRVGADMAFDFRPVRFAPSNYVSHQDFLLADLSIFDAGATAEAEGYDAVCIDTMSDSGMSALRSVMDIPVIGPGRHSMLLAQMLGEKFSIIAMWDRWKPIYVKTIAELGIAHKCASIRAAGLTPDNRNLLAGKEDEVFPALRDAAMRCIEEDGAEVILIGSTTMHEAHAYLTKTLPVPVINPGPMSYRLAETAVKLRLAHSRLAYPKPGKERLEMLKAMGAAAAAAEAAAAQQ